MHVQESRRVKKTNKRGGAKGNTGPVTTGCKRLLQQTNKQTQRQKQKQKHANKHTNEQRNLDKSCHRKK